MLKTAYRKKNSIFLSFLTLTIFLSGLQLFITVQGSPTVIASVQQPPIDSGEAHSNIDITFDSESIDYKRDTHISNLRVNPEMDLILFSAFALYTTHQDILLDFHMEFNTSFWNDNFTEFNNSGVITAYKQQYEAVKHLTPIEVTLLDVGPKQFEAGNDTRFDPDDPQQKITTFYINHQVVIREATAFIITLNEPFRFDLNRIRLGLLEDFRLEVFFDKEHRFYDEILHLSAQGSPLEENTATKGLGGVIRLGEDYGPQEIPRLNRAFGSVNQSIDMEFIFPKEQTLSAPKFGFGGFEEEGFVGDSTNVEEWFITDYETTARNSFSMHFVTEDWMPITIAISTQVPIWEQISITEYLSYAASAVFAAIAILKGLPFYLKRRGLGGLRKELYTAAANGNWTAFDEVIDGARKKQLNRKISADQLKNFLFESEMVKEQQSKLKEAE
ncbi:MAG: hypothetical protein ACFFD4_11690 [Candidatus Odinarchaeota archaeon]